MKQLTTAFSMVWGNFTVLPCPYKRWDSKLNNLMLALLPVVGAVIGGLWMLLFWVLRIAAIPSQLTTLAATFYIYAVCGFMHMDGFMDCNDAILSRRPLEDRQRILKDSTVGAFAVVTVVFLVLAFFVSMKTFLAAVASQKSPEALWALALIPVMSRGTAGLGVLVHRPIGHSQYKGSYQEKGKQKYQLTMILLMGVAMCATACLAGRFWWLALGGSVLVILAGLITMERARRNLDGMSGDIAGYTICWSELIGVLGLAVLLPHIPLS
ncbi:MAG: adenosylcobinamide-GDP ribazoletransferase [Eubacterium sp.]|nr:adenosylcobinamide-GDP ribazoletransferase [Eubacterium sp.]